MRLTAAAVLTFLVVTSARAQTAADTTGIRATVALLQQIDPSIEEVS